MPTGESFYGGGLGGGSRHRPRRAPPVAGPGVNPQASAPQPTHYPSPAPQVSGSSGYPGTPASHSAPAPTPSHVSPATHPILSSLSPAELALGAYAIAAAKTYGLTPEALIGVNHLANATAPEKATLRDIAGSAREVPPAANIRQQTLPIRASGKQLATPDTARQFTGAPPRQGTLAALAAKGQAPTSGPASRANLAARAFANNPALAAKGTAAGAVYSRLNRSVTAKGKSQKLQAVARKGTPQQLLNVAGQIAPKRTKKALGSLLFATTGNTPQHQNAKTGKGASAALAHLGIAGSGHPKDKRSPYVNPFHHSQQAIQTRTDQGVDYYGSGAIGAIGKAKIVSTGSNWPGGGGVVYQLLDGPRAGRHVFVYEDVTATVSPGDVVPRGGQIATFAPGGSLEMGWADPTGQTAAVAQGQHIAPDTASQGGHFSRAGLAFQGFLHRLGGATPKSQLDPHIDVAGKTGRGFGAGPAPPLTSPQVNRAVSHVLAAAGYQGNPRAGAVAKAAIKWGRKYNVSPALLTAISKVESGMGTSTLPGVRSGSNSAGAAGPMQMGDGTGAAGNAWQTYSAQIWGAKASQHSVYNISDAMRAAAVYLKTAGAPASISDTAAAHRGAFAYNHADWYANEVVATAQRYAALDGVSGAVGNVGGTGGALATGSAAAPGGTGAAPGGVRGVAGTIAAPGRRAAAQARARIGFTLPYSPTQAASPLPFGFQGSYTGAAPSGSRGSFRPRRRLSTAR